MIGISNIALRLLVLAKYLLDSAKDSMVSPAVNILLKVALINLLVSHLPGKSEPIRYMFMALDTINLLLTTLLQKMKFSS